MNDIKDILLDGEEVLWSGAPDWSKAERPKDDWRSKSGVVKFAAAMLIAFSVMMAFGFLIDPRGFAGGILGVLIVLSAISFVFALMNLFGGSDEIQHRHDHVYAITSERIIIHDRSKFTTRSIMGNVLYEVATVQNGNVQDINIMYANPDDDFETLHALSNAVVPKKLLIENFSRRKAKR